MPLLSQSREIFLICTPDIPSLHFARAKAQFLRDSGFEERSSVVINRSEIATPFSIAELEKLLGAADTVFISKRSATHRQLNEGRRFR